MKNITTAEKIGSFTIYSYNKDSDSTLLCVIMCEIWKIGWEWIPFDSTVAMTTHNQNGCMVFLHSLTHNVPSIAFHHL